MISSPQFVAFVWSAILISVKGTEGGWKGPKEDEEVCGCEARRSSWAPRSIPLSTPRKRSGSVPPSQWGNLTVTVGRGESSQIWTLIPPIVVGGCHRSANVIQHDGYIVIYFENIVKDIMTCNRVLHHRYIGLVTPFSLSCPVPPHRSRHTILVTWSSF